MIVTGLVQMSINVFLDSDFLTLSWVALLLDVSKTLLLLLKIFLNFTNINKLRININVTNRKCMTVFCIISILTTVSGDIFLPWTEYNKV